MPWATDILWDVESRWSYRGLKVVFRLSLLILTCTLTHSLTSHLKIDDCLHLKELSHIVALGNTTLGHRPRATFLQDNLSGCVHQWDSHSFSKLKEIKTSNMWVSTVQYIRVCWQLPEARCAAAGYLRVLQRGHLGSGGGLNVAPAVAEQLKPDRIKLCPFTPGLPEEIGLIVKECERHPHHLVCFTFTLHFCMWTKHHL